MAISLSGSVIHSSVSITPRLLPSRNVTTTAKFLTNSRHHHHHDHALSINSAFSGTGSSSSNNVVVTEEDTNSLLLDTVQVFDLNGNGIQISDLWKDRKTVVAFARHFGCVLCRKRADYLASKKDVMDASGVTLVLIGPGSIDQAKSFKEQTKFDGEVYADPSQSSYEALRFVSGISSTFSPKAGLKIIELYMEGYRQDWKLTLEKDTVARGGWQQGGILVAGPGKTNILYLYKDKDAGDEPNIREILEACCS
ncbi:hypothetical protein ACFE04_020584 [Oxalis oulophora]